MFEWLTLTYQTPLWVFVLIFIVFWVQYILVGWQLHNIRKLYEIRTELGKENA